MYYFLLNSELFYVPLHSLITPLTVMTLPLTFFPLASERRYQRTGGFSRIALLLTQFRVSRVGPCQVTWLQPRGARCHPFSTCLLHPPALLTGLVVSDDMYLNTLGRTPTIQFSPPRFHFRLPCLRALLFCLCLLHYEPNDATPTRATEPPYVSPSGRMLLYSF
jgi:hypothetical protein